MQQFGRQSDILFAHQPPIVAVIGWSGFNAQKRIAPELAGFNGRIKIVGYDLRQPANDFNGIPWIIVRNNEELACCLNELHPDIVLIETPCDCHPEHIRIALEAGANLVISEKCIGWRVSQAKGVLLPALSSAHPEQKVFIVDHYLLLKLVLMLFTSAKHWLGEVRRMEVILFEEQGIPPHQERSHFDGMTNFFHHVVALASLFFDLNDLVPVQACWAKHPDANVPDTYRAAKFINKRTGDVVLEGAVGKYIKCPIKIVRIEGTKGVAVLDRDSNSLIVVNDGLWMDVRCDYDSGYGELVNALANGLPLPPTLLSVEQALQVLHLVERAHEKAKQLPFYPDGQDVVFTDDA